jgi:hypothetical protein
MKPVQTRETTLRDIRAMMEILWRCVDVASLNKFMERKIDIFFSEGYDNENYRTAFFCVTGSPNKFWGWIDWQSSELAYAKTNLGSFKYRLGHGSACINGCRWYKAGR